jgi:NitT/TauT family transport system substrate-binding protein
VLNKFTKSGLERKIFKSFFSFLLVFSFVSCSKTKSNKAKLGYLLNITHAVPIIAIEEGMFDDYEVMHFVSGGYLLNSLMSKNIDIAFIGPGPYINAINKGLDLKLLGLSAVGANAFILNNHFKDEKQIEIKKIAVPQFGNTQDLLARDFIKRVSNAKANNNHLSGNMKEIFDELAATKNLNFSDKLEYIAVHPAELEMVLHKNECDAALVAEPWGTVLTERGYTNLSTKLKSKSLISSLDDEYETLIRDEINRLNTFPATLLVVRKEYYDNHVREIENLLVKNDYVLDIITMDTESALKSIQKHFNKIAGKSFSMSTLKASMRNISFSSELDLNHLEELEDVALAAKYIKERKVLLAQSKETLVE